MGMKAEATADLATLLAQAGWLRRFARALVGDAAGADDLAQETMLSALGRPAAGRGRAWLATVARNLAVNRFRADTRRQRREEAIPWPSDGRVASPEQLIGSAEVHRHVAQAIAGLAEPFRQTVVLRFYEGLSSAEIARRLSEPEGTIRWRLKEALARVRAELDRRYGGDRSAWQAALLPLLPAPRAEAPSRNAPAARLGRASPAAASPLVTVLAVGLLLVVGLGVVAVVVRRSSAPQGAQAGTAPVATLPSDGAAARPISLGMRAGLPSLDVPIPPASASHQERPGRADAQSLAEELLTAIAAKDYDAFVAKGSPAFRLAAGQDRLEAAHAALGDRLSHGRHVAVLGDVHRHRTTDWIFKLQFDDDGDDLLCNLAMEGWQVAGFAVTEGIPQLTEK